jgi:alanyl-tRNA synthetase
MTGAEIRQSFLDFFRSKQHTIVPSSSLLPDAPNLLFTNAGMNQFVPIFLGQHRADVDKWPAAIPGLPTRAADTQKCIRAGGKHNDLDDVGLDTYHHTFFEMLGNWSFGDYFKKEAIEWAWELVVRTWKFPPARLYATVYQPSPGDPAEFDQEAYDHWARLFTAAGLEPQVHIVHGGKKDNFWMMGDTGPCGPCSEIHMDLTPAGDTKGSLVNQGDARCIEIWNLVFIQLNANPDGTFSPLPAKHVDTGMGFERVTSIIQGTKGFKDFTNAKISNYETDIFRPIFDEIEKFSGRKYSSTLPPTMGSTGDSPVPLGDPPNGTGRTPLLPSDAGPWKDPPPLSAGLVAQRHGPVAHATPEQSALDVAFRVIADHIRTLSFAIADGIQPGNTDRSYVLRRILRRAVRYGRTLGFHEPFFYKLVDVLADTMGGVFPEIRAKKNHVQAVIRTEEEAFNRTLDTGLMLFHEVRRKTRREIWFSFFNSEAESDEAIQRAGFQLVIPADKFLNQDGIPNPESMPLILKNNPRWLKLTSEQQQQAVKKAATFPAEDAFKLYDTYGFPIDLTELIAREWNLTVDKEAFEKLMEQQRARARAAQKKEIISISQIESTVPTNFIGYDKLDTPAKVLEVVAVKDKTAVILDTSVCYAEMGGQVGDTGEISQAGQLWRITNTQKSGNTWLHVLGEDRVERATGPSGEANRLAVPVGGSPTGAGEMPVLPVPGDAVTVSVDRSRRAAIQRHHTVTHLFHWALHEVVSKDATQKGSYVGPEKLTFDFNSGPLAPKQIAAIERLVNERILENAAVSWTEVPYAEVKARKDVLQFFGEKYGDTVRVVQIGGQTKALDGYSMELCGGTHTRATGEIGLFRIVAESAIAAGIRRIEAVAGLEAYSKATSDLQLIKTLAGKVNSPVAELERKIEAMLAQQKELEKQVRIALQRNASNAASELLGRVQTVNGIPIIAHNLGDADGEFLQAIADALRGRFKGLVVLGGYANNAIVLVATVSSDFTDKVQAGKIIQQIAPIVGGKGGGKPDNARGGGKDASKLDEALAKVKALLG